MQMWTSTLNVDNISAKVHVSHLAIQVYVSWYSMDVCVMSSSCLFTVSVIKADSFYLYN